MEFRLIILILVAGYSFMNDNGSAVSAGVIDQFKRRLNHDQMLYNDKSNKNQMTTSKLDPVTIDGNVEFSVTVNGPLEVLKLIFASDDLELDSIFDSRLGHDSNNDARSASTCSDNDSHCRGKSNARESYVSTPRTRSLDDESIGFLRPLRPGQSEVTPYRVPKIQPVLINDRQNRGNRGYIPKHMETRGIFGAAGYYDQEGDSNIGNPPPFVPPSLYV